jgi:DNA-binding transcriptional regulator LsrR (DeoR family)
LLNSLAAQLNTTHEQAQRAVLRAIRQGLVDVTPQGIVRVPSE